MNNNDQNQQNGRQRPLPPDQTSPQQSSSSDGICRDFVWGICGKGAQCRFRHVLNFESMKKILKFCHNFQNKRGCNSCTYLHTSSDEETLFLRTGQIPRVLRERYATMAMSNPGNVYLTEILSQPPPPPPPLPPQPVQSSHSTLPPALPPLPAPLSTLLAPPPPPPPPTATTTPVQMAPPVFTGPIQISPTPEYQANLGHRSHVIPKFDASRPPPPLPSTSVVHLPNGTLKRSAETQAQAGPSKCRKVEGASVVDHSQCEKCSHRKTRADEFTEQARTLEYGERYQKCIIEQKREAIENGKLLLESVLSPGMYRIWEEYIEGSSSRERHYIDDILNIAQNIISAGARPSTFGNDNELSIQTILRRVLSANNTENFEGDSRNINNLPSTSGNVGNSSPIAGSTAGISRHPLNIATGSLQSVSTASTSALSSEIAAPSSSGAAHLPNGANIPQSVPTTHLQAHAQNVSYFMSTPQPQSANVQNGPQQQNEAHHQNVSHPQSVPPVYNPANMPNISQPQSTSQSHNMAQSQIRFRFRYSTHQSVSHPNVTHARNQQEVNRYQQNGPQMQGSHSGNVAHMQGATYSQSVAHLQAGGHVQNINHRRAVGPSQNINVQPPAPTQNRMPAVTPATVYDQHYQAGVPQPSASYAPYVAPPNNAPNRPYAPPRANAANQANAPQPGPSTPSTSSCSRFPYTPRFPGPQPPPPQ